MKPGDLITLTFDHAATQTVRGHYLGEKLKHGKLRYGIELLGERGTRWYWAADVLERTKVRSHKRGGD